MQRDPTSMVMDASALGWVAFPLYGTRLDFFLFFLTSCGGGEEVYDMIPLRASYLFVRFYFILFDFT